MSRGPFGFSGANRHSPVCAYHSPLTANRVPERKNHGPRVTCSSRALRRSLGFSEDAIVEIVSALALIGWLNRWTCALAPALEPDALTFAQAHLAPAGWTPGVHARGE